jgi:signal transduction histidine kinase
MSKPKSDPRTPTTDYPRRIVESLTEGVVVFDREGLIRVANPALATLLSQPAPARSRLEDLIERGVPLHDALLRALAGESLTDEDIQFGAADGRVLWLRLTATPLEDEKSNLLGTMVILKDVSDLKRTEREIWQVEKMSALGRLAASVAHEVGNPLGAIDIQLQLLQEDVAALGEAMSAKSVRRLQIARAEMKRLEGIVQNFLRFSRPPTLHLLKVSPNDLLTRVIDLVAPEAREQGIDLSADLETSLAAVLIDENQLSQALLNVIINAFQAISADARVQLFTKEESDWVIFEVTDNGCGIAPEDMEHIFEYYYTTKDEGTGLGLSIAQRIVHHHGGTLELESREGEGTTVAIRLPAVR